jgi:spermidine synthase
MVLVAFALLTSACARADARTVVYEGDSAFNHLLVEDDGRGVRSLYFEASGATQSAIKLGAPLDLQLAYSKSAMVVLGLVPEPRRILIIGLGGGAMPMFLRALYPKVLIEVVDIDPKVVEVARRYFGFKEDPRMKAVVADGRKYLEAAEPGFDLIFLDAYGRSEIPRHLATVEFLKEVRQKLGPKGAVVGNVWSGQSNALYAPMVRSYARAFGEICDLDVPSAGNRLLLHWKAGPLPAAVELGARAEALGKRKAIPFDLKALAIAGCLQDVAGEGEVLTDRL